MSHSVHFENVGKQYLLGHRTNSLRTALTTSIRRLVHPTAQRPTFEALRDVTFSIASGESLGIIGRNGSGKSTVLKILAGITAPSSGVSRTRGRVAALLEVGTGFHSELTGRQNIYLNGSILGMPRREISAKFDSIVEFSGVSEFIDTPVKRYSSGMYLRLAFSIAAHVDPDILVVDEILAVGDTDFQKRCLQRLAEIAAEGRTVVFVSHDMSAVNSLCQRALWLHHGQLRADGPAEQVIRSYLSSEVSAAEPIHTGTTKIWPAEITTTDGHTGTVFIRGDDLHVTVRFETSRAIHDPEIALYLSRDDGVRILDEVYANNMGALPAATYEVSMTIPAILNTGNYVVGLWFSHEGAVPHDDPTSARIRVEGDTRDRPERILTLSLPIRLRRIDPPDGGEAL